MLRITAHRNLRVAALMAVMFKAALWGLSMPLTKSLVDVYEPCTLGAVRLAIALCVFAPILLIQGKRPMITREVVLLGLTGVTLLQVFQNTGMQSVSAGDSMIVLYGGIVIATAALGRLWLREACPKPVLGALALSAVGVGLVAFDFSDRSGLGMSPVGTTLLLAGAVVFAVYTVIGKRVAAADLTTLNAGVLTVGFLAILPLSAREARPSLSEALEPGHVAALFTLGVAVSTGSYFSWSYGLRHLPVTEASVLSSSEPVFGLVFAWLLLREGISIWEGVGAAVIVASCVLVALVASKPREAPVDDGASGQSAMPDTCEHAPRPAPAIWTRPIPDPGTYQGCVPLASVEPRSWAARSEHDNAVAQSNRPPS